MQQLDPQIGIDRRFIILTILLVILVGMGMPVPTFAQSESDEFEATAEHSYEFGSSMTFNLDIVNDPPVSDVLLVINVSTFPTPIIKEFELSQAEPFAEVNFRHKLQLQEIKISPFARITYSWEIALADEERVALPTTTFVYEDNRFDWVETQTVDGSLRIFTTDPSGELGQIGANVAGQAVPTIQKLIPAELTIPISIYLYPSTEAYEEAIRLTGVAWSGGHTDPSTGVIMIPVDNTNTAPIDLTRTLPHELSHLLLFRATGTQYQAVPRWFDEGLATQFEDPPNADYIAEVNAIFQDQRMIPFSDLCDRFPSQPEAVVLSAYSQSYSFVRYLRGEFGDDVIRNMVLELQNGADCETVTERVFNSSLEELTNAWRATTNPVGYILGVSYIWIVGGIFLLTLLIIGVVWIQFD